MATPASVTMVGWRLSGPHSARIRAMASASVPHSETCPGRMSQACGKSVRSSISAEVARGPSCRRLGAARSHRTRSRLGPVVEMRCARRLVPGNPRRDLEGASGSGNVPRFRHREKRCAQIRASGPAYRIRRLIIRRAVTLVTAQSCGWSQATCYSFLALVLQSEPCQRM